MSWLGTLIGGAFGLMLGGPIGAFIGAALGGMVSGSGRGGPINWDDGSRQERAQAAFFAATFGVMGHVAKADGRVSPEEIQVAEQIMDQLGLNAQQRRAARALFNEGKASVFPLDEVLDQLRSECLRGANIRRMFLQIQFQAAWADGGLHGNERRLLQHIAARLGLSPTDFIEVERMFGSAVGADANSPSLEDAYETLGVSPDTPLEEVKRAYRRMMSRYHPDKLAAKGLPEEMTRAATERTQKIKAAWDAIKSSRAA